MRTGHCLTLRRRSPMGKMLRECPSEELLTFLDGFAQGARCTLYVELKCGENGHHIWEAVYRAVGIALGGAMTVDQNRIGKTFTGCRKGGV